MWPAEIDWREIADRLPGALLIVNLDGNLVEANERGRALLGVQGSVQGISLSSRLTETEDAFRRYLRICGGSFQPMPGRITVKQADGDPVRHAVSGARVNIEASGGSGGLIVLWSSESVGTSAHARFATLNATINQLTQEVRARRQAEALLEAEKHVLEMIVHGEPIAMALEQFALTVEEHTTGMLVSILLVDDAGRLRHAAAPNLPARYVEAIDGTSIGPMVGSCGTAAVKNKTVIVTDIVTDPRWEDYRDIALQAGLRSCWSAPIRGSDGSVLGTLALYYRSTRVPSESELRLIENSALIAGICIEHYRTQKNLVGMLAREHEERERAEAESRAKDHFLAILSHELRNPLAAAANAAYALEALGDSDQRQSELQGIIVSSTSMLKRILDDLLDLSRLNTGKLGLQIAPLDFAEMMNELVSTFRTTYADRELSFSCSSDSLWVDGDRARLQQIVSNLLGNALKYSEETDGIWVELSGDRHEICLSIRDAGRGIDATLLPNIFTAFVQSDESLDRADSGLGLGLALVRQFAEMHKGSISAHSEGLGLGSEFVLRLPRRSTPEIAQSEKDNITVPRSCRVLVVEDNAEARVGLCRLLERWGHNVTPAADGEEGLNLMRENPPEVALVDIGLPGISGYEVARAVRSESALANVRLIALTGYGQEKDRELTTEVGFERHLVKPVNLADLTEIFGARIRP